MTVPPTPHSPRAVLFGTEPDVPALWALARTQDGGRRSPAQGPSAPLLRPRHRHPLARHADLAGNHHRHRMEGTCSLPAVDVRFKLTHYHKLVWRV